MARDRSTLIRSLILIKPFWPDILRSVALTILGGLISIAIPYTTKLLIDEVLRLESQGLMHFIVVATALMGVTNLMVNGIRTYFTAYIGLAIGNSICLVFFNHLLHMPIGFYEGHQVGEIGSRFADVKMSLMNLSNIFSGAVLNLLYLILVPPVLFAVQSSLALASLVLVPIIGLVSLFFARYLRSRWKKACQAAADVSAVEFETLSQVRTLKSLACEHEIFRKCRNSIIDAQEANTQAIRANQLMSISTGTLSTINTAIFTWFGWSLILDHQMTLGSFIAFSMYVGYLYGPVLSMSTMISDLQLSLVSAARVFEYVDAKPEQDPELAFLPPSPIRLDRPITHGIYYRDVSFGYDGKKEVLKKLNLFIPCQKITFLAGASGSGKSTIVRLLLRFNEPDSGEITIDGKSGTEIGLLDLRRQVSVVLQDAVLFRGTVWENLVLGSQDVSKQKVAKAVETCCLEEFISSLPNGYGTQVAELGATLSGGQRQRMAIARALIRGGSVLVLDEATSSIDAQTEMEILKHIASFADKMTFVIISHRLATARIADQVCFLHEGAIVGVGSHNSLLRDCSEYREMYGAAVPEEDDHLDLKREPVSKTTVRLYPS